MPFRHLDDPAPRPRLPRSVLAIAAGRAVSFLGDEVALLAIAFRAKAELGHFGVAAILIAGFVPLLVLSPFTGLLVDRVRTRPILVVVSLVQAATCLGLAWSGSALLVPLVALLACGTALSAPAWSALVPALVADDQLPSAMGLLQGAQAVAGVAGPFLGGLLVGLYGFHAPLVVDAASFVVLALVPLALRVDRVPSERGGALSWREAFAGVSLISRQPMLRSLVVLAVCFVVSLGVVNVAEIYFVTSALHAGPFGYGMLGLSMGVGMLAVNATVGTLSRRGLRAEPMFVVGCVGLCVAIASFGLTAALWEAGCVVFLAGAFNALLNVNAMVLITRNASEAVRGRVFAAVNGVVSAAQIGALATGGLLLLVVAPRSIILGGAVASAAALCVTVGPVLRASVASPLAEGGDGGVVRAEVDAATA